MWGGKEGWSKEGLNGEVFLLYTEQAAIRVGHYLSAHLHSLHVP